MYIKIVYLFFVFREEELQMQKRKKRRVRGDPRLSFCDEIENGSDEDEFENRMVLLTFLGSCDILFCITMF